MFVFGVGAVAVFLTAILLYVIVCLRSRYLEEKEGQYWINQDKWLLYVFDNYDVGVYGFRGSGKDVVFAHAINLKGGKHYSNIFYNWETEIRDIKDLHVGGNTYEDFINGTTQPFEPNFEDGFHYFLSDGGVYLGCQYNKELNQNFSEVPIHIALRRHLYDSHVHVNSQALNRPWDKVREQQGCFIHCLGTVNYGDFLIVSAISYTNYESALGCLPPPEKPDKYYTMKYGEIKEHKFKVPIKSLTYNSRHFRTQLLIQNEGEKAEYGRATIII